MIASRTRQLMFALFCAAVLLPRLGGPHLHLCLDGAVPAVYLHMSDAASSQQPDAEHEDTSLEMPSPVIGKLSSAGSGVLLVSAVLLMVVALQQALLLLSLPAGIAVPQRPPYLRPLLRGPPARLP
jgi:hypothetical protein